MKSDIKIFMCAHRSFDTLPAFAVAVQGGAKINPPIEGTIPDIGDGGSISEKNPDYCELTVQYYAWKNEQADYYGFCHYRRFLSFDEKIKKPYLVFGKRLKKRYSDIIQDESLVRAQIEACDVVLPRREYLGVDVYTKFADAEGCCASDLYYFEKLIGESYPELSVFAKKYFESCSQYFCNMFVMKREIFFDYCEKLFFLLDRFDEFKSPDVKVRGDRLDGFLAERFLGAYVEYLRENGKKIREFARLDINCPLKKRILFKFCPPENKIRFFVKKLKGDKK